MAEKGRKMKMKEQRKYLSFPLETRTREERKKKCFPSIGAIYI